MTARNCRKCYNETYELPTGNRWSQYCPAHGRFDEDGNHLRDDPEERIIVCAACGHYKDRHSGGAGLCSLCPESDDPCLVFTIFLPKETTAP